jgi:hypothetical protein
MGCNKPKQCFRKHYFKSALVNGKTMSTGRQKESRQMMMACITIIFALYRILEEFLTMEEGH